MRLDEPRCHYAGHHMEFLRNPERGFEHLVDSGPRDGQAVLPLRGQPTWSL